MLVSFTNLIVDTTVKSLQIEILYLMFINFAIFSMEKSTGNGFTESASSYHFMNR